MDFNKFYQKLIHLRHTHPVIVYGDYRLLLPEDPQIFAYIRNLDGRQLLAVSNLSGAPASMELPVEFRDGKILISNYEDTGLRPAMTLRPWEAFAIEL